MSNFISFSSAIAFIFFPSPVEHFGASLTKAQSNASCCQGHPSHPRCFRFGDAMSCLAFFVFFLFFFVFFCFFFVLFCFYERNKQTNESRCVRFCFVVRLLLLLLFARFSDFLFCFYRFRDVNHLEKRNILKL